MYDYMWDTLDGTELGFKLGNYTTLYNYTESIGFKYDNLLEMFDGVTFAGDDDTTGEQTARDVGYLDSAVELNPGELHIEFSDSFPGSYIDNAGFVTKFMYDGTSAFVFTVVPADDAAAEAIMGMTLQNKLSGNIKTTVNKLSDGRIMFRYLAKADSTYYGDEYSAIITMKNGTTFYADEGGCEAGWEVNENVGQSWWAAWKLATYINPADVESVTWHGVVLYQAK